VFPPHTVTSSGEFCPWQHDTPHLHDPCEPLLHQYTAGEPTPTNNKKCPRRNMLSSPRTDLSWGFRQIKKNFADLIHDLCSSPNIIWVIESSRNMRWVLHVAR
jgi:hypothetical protein